MVFINNFSVTYKCNCYFFAVSYFNRSLSFLCFSKFRCCFGLYLGLFYCFCLCLGFLCFFCFCLGLLCFFCFCLGLLCFFCLCLGFFFCFRFCLSFFFCFRFCLSFLFCFGLFYLFSLRLLFFLFLIILNNRRNIWGSHCHRSIAA